MHGRFRHPFLIGGLCVSAGHPQAAPTEDGQSRFNSGVRAFLQRFDAISVAAAPGKLCRRQDNTRLFHCIFRWGYIAIPKVYNGP